MSPPTPATNTPTWRIKTLVFGFVRRHEKALRAQVPTELTTLIARFHPRRYRVVGIGYQQYNQFGLKPEFAAQHRHYDKIVTLQRWSYLASLSALCEHPSFVSCADRNFFIRTFDDEIYAIGNNHHGALGVDSANDEIERFSRVALELDSGEQLDVVSRGFCNHSVVAVRCACDGAQRFFGFGNNEDQQQGAASPSGQFRRRPTRLSSLERLLRGVQIVAMATGEEHSLLLSARGAVFSCGYNGYGQCGVDIRAANDYCVAPQRIAQLERIVSVSSGCRHNLCVDDAGALWVFGQNTSNQLGLGDAMSDTNWLKTPQVNPLVPRLRLRGGAECGYGHSLCLGVDGTAFMFGGNIFGECGNGRGGASVSTPFRVQSMRECRAERFEAGALGYNHTVLLSEKNELFGFGGNVYSQCGNVNGSSKQAAPYKVQRRCLGIGENHTIVRVIADDGVTVVIAEEIEE